MLWEDQLKEYELCSFISVSDGNGGFTKSITKTGTVDAAVLHVSDSEQEVADGRKVSSAFAVISKASIPFHSILRLGNDLYRLTTDSHQYPASFGVFSASAERFEVNR